MKIIEIINYLHEHSIIPNRCSEGDAYHERYCDEDCLKMFEIIL